MSKTVQKIASLALAIGLSVTPSFAADQLADEVEEYTPVEFGTGWYIRGDIGVSFLEATSDITVNAFSGETGLGHPITLGVGGGYQLNKYIRGEVMLGQLTSLEVGLRSDTIGCGNEFVLGIATPITGNCYIAVNGEPAHTSLMANAYFDFGTYYGITPYVGAGVGTTYVTWNQLSSQIICIGNGPADCGAGGGAGFNQLANDVYNAQSAFVFSYNVMAGFAYDLSENWKLDVGYRWLTVGSVDVASTSNNPGIQTGFNSGTMDVHEIKVGLRYEIW